MRITSLFVCFVLASTHAAPQAHDHQHGHEPGRLGTVHFEISCDPGVRAPFHRAVAMLHSFWYAEARKTFTEVAAADPACGMAQWGVAMTYYQPLWAPPNPEELKQGAEAARKAVAAGARTARERAYIAAIAAFYADAGRLSHAERGRIYEKAMEALHRDHPSDAEAAIFYALALLGTAPPTDKQYVNQKKAAAILNGLLDTHREHPGIAHYIIHSFDYPDLAELALPAARSYAKIAPDSPHALHMPSHIFTRLGLWDESIASNIDSAASAKRHVQRTRPGAAAFDQLHAMDYLAYAYLQQGRDRMAKEVLDEMLAVRAVDLANVAAAHALAAIPARYALERRQWKEAAALSLHPPDFPWGSFRFGEAVPAFARGMGAARSGDTAAAKKEIARLDALRRELEGAPGYDWSSQAEVQRRTVEAWVAWAEGKTEEALRLMRSAADLEDRTDKHPVTPGAVLPARELLGEMLLEAKRPAEALAAFEAALRESPKRLNGLYGAWRAATQANDREKAVRFSSQLVTLTDKADTPRPELQELQASAR